MRSRSWFSSTGYTLNPGTSIFGYGMANFRLQWNNIEQSRVGGALFVANAFDKIYYTGGLQTGSIFGLDTAIPGRPRM